MRKYKKGIQKKIKRRYRKIESIRNKKGFIIDMDGVIYHGSKLLSGAEAFLNWLYENDKAFLFLTNNSGKRTSELREKLLGMGLDVDESHFYTSALATAKFLSEQMSGCRAYVIGESGLIDALTSYGIEVTDESPDYVVVGEGSDYVYEKICKAVNFVLDGAKLIGTNYDMTGPVECGIIPACRALISPIEMATGQNAYFVGKPNPLMMRTGLNMLGVHSADAVMVGDRMDTDIIAGIESGLDTVLVLSGVTTLMGVKKFPYRPRVIVNSVGDIAQD